MRCLLPSQREFPAGAGPERRGGVGRDWEGRFSLGGNRKGRAGRKRGMRPAPGVRSGFKKHTQSLRACDLNQTVGGNWLGASPAGRVLAPAGAAAAEQREQQAEEQREQRAGAHHTFALIGLCGGAAAQRRITHPTSFPGPTFFTHSPRWQAPVTGSHDSS